MPKYLVETEDGAVYEVETEEPTAQESAEKAARQAQITPVEQYLPTAAGITGAVAGGALLKSPAAASLLSGLGQAGGQGIVEYLKAKQGLPGPTEDVTERLATEFLIGAGTEAGGQAIGAGAKRIAEIPMVSRWLKGIEAKLPPKPETPEAMRQLKILEREGVPYTAGDITPGGALQQIENLVRGMMFGGKHIAAQDRATTAAMVAWQRRLLNGISGLDDPYRLGTEILQGVTQRKRGLFGGMNPLTRTHEPGLFDRLYGRISAKLGNAPIDVAALQAKAQPLIDEIEKLKALAPKEAGAEFNKSIYQEVLRKIAGGEYKTYSDIWNLKKILGALHESKLQDPFGGLFGRNYKMIYGMLNETMEQTARAVDPNLARYTRKVNASYMQALDLMKHYDLVENVTQLSPEQIATKYFGTNVPLDKTNDLLRAIPPNKRKVLYPAIQRRRIESILDQFASSTLEGVSVEKAKVLQDHYRKQLLNLENLFRSDPQKLEGVKDFIDALARSQASGRIINPASGRQLLAWGQAAALVTSGSILITQGEFGQAAETGAAIIFAPWIVSRALMNPKIARFLARGFELSPEAARKLGWTGRAVNILQAIEKWGEPEMEVKTEGFPMQ